MCMLKLKYLKYFKYAAKPMAGACMALALRGVRVLQVAGATLV